MDLLCLYNIIDGHEVNLAMILLSSMGRGRRVEGGSDLVAIGSDNYPDCQVVERLLEISD